MINRINILLGFTVFLTISFLCNGQIAVGQWRDHLPYNQGERIVKADNKIYMVTNVGMYNYNTNTGETQKMSKITGLSDSGVKSINYHNELGILVVGYRNGNIDLITGFDIHNIADIRRKAMTGDKTIYDIMFIDEYAYLACGFGIVQLDLDRREIRNTFFIGDLGSALRINQLTYDGQNIYAATESGVLMGNTDDFLVDFSNWQEITNINTGRFSWMQGNSFNYITYFEGNLLANYYNSEESDSDTIMIYDGTTWSVFNESWNRNNVIVSGNDRLIIGSTYWFREFNQDLEQIRYYDTYRFSDENIGARAAHFYVDSDDVIWIADQRQGMVKSTGGWRYERFQINGPSSHEIFALEAVGNTVIGLAGGMDLSWGPLWKHATFYNFSNETWNSFSTPSYRDLVSIAINPNDPNHFFAGSWISGLLEVKNNEIINVYDNTNSTINNVQGHASLFRVGGLSFDRDGNLWVTNSRTSPPFSVMDTDGNWTGLDYSNQIGEINIDDIIITKDNIKWVILRRGDGIFVFDDNGTPDDLSDDRYRKLNIRNENGEIISNEVYSIAEDKNGYIWVGTNKGVAVYYNPENVFDDPNFHSRQIKIPRNDGTDNADLLLATEVVTTINVDGANKKWFGTQSAGAFYTSSDGLEQIHHFNADNSPLLDNNILCLTINPNTGEVFFGTTQGIVSYRATATEGADDYDKVYAFPNPVRPDYHGPITITGLVAGSYVKITDISGNLVYETRSEGGQAIWYGKNLNGNRVQTGVYLVMSTNEDGSKTDITKILFIN